MSSWASCSANDQCETGLCRSDVCVPCNVDSDCPAERNLCYRRRCIASPVCGNGVREPGEACDGSEGCSADCRFESGQGCRDDRDCESNRCENGVCLPCVPGEGTCGERLCGNGKPDAGEECDLGGENNDLLSDRCRTDCHNPRCGDGVADRNEQCDDGNGVSGDGCDRLCRIEVRTVTIDLPTTSLTADITSPLAPGHAPIGQTGPAAIAVMAAGGAAGWAWMRRRKTR
ncbi:MAG: hypothetical protein HOO67_07620 [Candidatus Peribacteraceae bacterium]|nr:hypothetical protein [Candidatus Peribacteraceae bacterium]